MGLLHAYIDDQFAKPATKLPVDGVAAVNQPANCTSPLTPGGPADALNFGTNCPRDLYTQFVSQRYFFKNALTAPDQLRQRVTWALSQILGDFGAAATIRLGTRNRNYQQLLQDYAFDNFWNLLFRISVDPLMGNYLDMVNNAKADPVKDTNPNENYAREIMQLFSIGLWELNNDGTLSARRGRQPDPDILADRHHRDGEGDDRLDVLADHAAHQVELADQLPRQHDAVRGPDAARRAASVCGTQNWHDTTRRP